MVGGADGLGEDLLLAVVGALSSSIAASLLDMRLLCALRLLSMLLNWRLVGQILTLLSLGSYTKPIRRLNWWSAPRDGGDGDI